MSKREQAATILGSPVARRLWAAAGNRNLRILAYHRVLDDAPAAFAFDEELISATTGAFRQQMDFVRRNFNVINFQQLYECERAGRAWPERALIVTFDDGYRDNYANAFPILKEMRLGATIFLAASHINQAKLFWWDLIAYCFKQTRRPSVTFSEIDAAPFALDSSHERRKAVDRVLEWIKRVPEDAKNSFLARLHEQLDVALPSDLAAGMHLSWEEVREMAAGGIEFGSHTMTHPVLANVSAAQLKDEVCRSKTILERELRREVVSFSYPVGGRSDFNQSVKQAVKECGYRFAVSYQEGIAEKASDHYSLPRIHVEESLSLKLFRANLMFPGLMLR